MPRLSLIVTTLALAVPLALGAGGPAAPAQAAQPTLTWAPCGDVADTECAGLELPIDYDNPSAGHFTLRLGRVPALDPAKRKGILLILPGGPGAGIQEELGAMRADYVLASVGAPWCNVARPLVDEPRVGEG